MSYRNYNKTQRRQAISGPAVINDRADVFNPTADQKYGLGTQWNPNDGTDRLFRYAKDGGAGLSKAAMAQSLAAVANWTEQALTSYTAAVGDKEIQITVATDLAANDIDHGWLCVMDGAGNDAALGDMYLIESHTTGGTPVLQIADSSGIRTALTVDAEVSVIPNKYRDIVGVPAAAATAIPVGVPLVDWTADYYGWIQTRGPAPLLVDTDNSVVGDQIGETATANTICAGGIHAVTYPIWGVIMSDSTNGQADQPVMAFLTLE